MREPGQEAAGVLAALGVALVASLVPGCGGDVSFCTDLDPAPPNCEVCTNGIDDDLDGHVDCDDSECRHAAACADVAATRTTSTTAASGETTTTLTASAD